MARLIPEREAQIRKECAGRGMVHAFLLFELFEEIRALQHEKEILSDALFFQEKRWRDKEDASNELGKTL
jgi:hypothetical protein